MDIIKPATYARTAHDTVMMRFVTRKCFRILGQASAIKFINHNENN